MQLTSETRNELKAVLSGMPYWKQYCSCLPLRSNGVPANTGNMVKDEWLKAAEAFGIDMLGLGNGLVAAGVASKVQSDGTVTGHLSAPQQPAAQPLTHTQQTVTSEGSDAYDKPIGPVNKPADTATADSRVTALLEPLEGIWGIVSPHIKKDIETRLDTALKASSGSDSVKTVDVPVYIDQATGQPVAVDKVTVANALNVYEREDTLGSVFGSRKADMLRMTCSIWSGDDTPAINDQYEYDTDILASVFACISNKHCVWLAGYAGTGKTDFVEQIAARTGRGFTRICFHAESEVAPFIGQYVPDGAGGYDYRHGALTLAIQKPGELILLDEVSSATHAIQTFLQTIQDKGKLMLPETGETVSVAPGVRFLVADNTLGFGDDTGAHQGKALVDRAALDRYAQFVWFDYPAKAKEARIIHNRTGLNKDACERLVDFADMARSAVRKGTGAIAYPVTIRRLFAWADGLVYGMDSVAIFKTAILNCAGADHEGLKEIEKAHLLGAGHSAITALARGETLPSEPVTSSEQGEAASAQFDAVNEG